MDPQYSFTLSNTTYFTYRFQDSQKIAQSDL